MKNSVYSHMISFSKDNLLVIDWKSRNKPAQTRAVEQTKFAGIFCDIQPILFTLHFKCEKLNILSLKISYFEFSNM